jgi:tetratricopeptide (TPR) repeat protein
MILARLARTALVTSLAISSSGCALVHSETWARLFSHRPSFDQQMAAAVKKQASTPDSQASETDIYYRAAAAAIYRRDYGQALDDLQIARERSPSDVRVLNAFGVVYDKLGRFDLSARYYAQALTVDPKSSIVSQNMAYSLALQNRSTSETRLAATTANPATAPAPTAVAQLQAPARAPGAPTNHVRVIAPGVLALDLPGASQQARLIPPGFTGHALVLVNASGRRGGGDAVRTQLASLGWTTPKSLSGQGPRQVQTTISYLASYEAAAKALARTLPGPVQLQSCTAGCDSIRVTLGADALKWKFAASGAAAERRPG